MRILVTGREGQVVRALVERGASSGEEIVALGRPELDLARNVFSIVDTIIAARPDAIVAAAAYTAVDKAEAEPDVAFAVNATGAGAVALAANRLAVPLVHLSTDYVFDGTNTVPYCEGDQTRPTGVYGRSKLAGELAVLAAHDLVAVLRTAWVYSPYSANFVRTMLRLAAERDEIRVVADQLGNPTSALDIADGVLAVARNLASDSGVERRGVFHMSGTGEASWASFAEAVFASSASLGGPVARVRPIVTAEYPTPAKRPANSRLDCRKLTAAHGVRLPSWQNSLPGVVERLVAPNLAKDAES